jgi:hypothetical protein
MRMMVPNECTILKEKLFPYSKWECLEAIYFQVRDGAFPNTPFVRTTHYKVEVIFRLIAADIACIYTDFVRLPTMQSNTVLFTKKSFLRNLLAGPFSNELDHMHDCNKYDDTGISIDYVAETKKTLISLSSTVYRYQVDLNYIHFWSRSEKSVPTTGHHFSTGGT